MRSPYTMVFVASLCIGALASRQAQAAFHAMQIEQVIGGVNGDTSAQAIQLRLRATGHNLVNPSRIRAWDATGANPILVIDMEAPIPEPPNNAGGRRILIASPGFATYSNSLTPDYTMSQLIPASYLAAGRLTFETDNGAIIYWSLAWGGAGYTGSNLGDTFNDADGNFGPPFAGALPSSSTSALLINRAFNQLSTTNAANYGVTPGAATFTNNANGTALVTIPPPDSGDFDDDNDVDFNDFLIWQQNAGAPGTFADGDANHDGNVDDEDLTIWENMFGTPPPLIGAVTEVPEPGSLCLLLSGLAALGLRISRRT